MLNSALWSCVAAAAIGGEGGVSLHSLLFLFVVLFIVTMLLLYPYLTRHRRAQGSSPTHHYDPRQQMDDEMAIRRTADQALVDLVETGREISAQIDTKIRILNTLTKDADRQCRRLEKLLGIADNSADEVFITSNLTPDKKNHNAAANDNSPTAMVRKPSSRTSSRRHSDLHTRVAALHDAGHSPDEVARLARISRAEVDIVLHILHPSNEPERE